MKMTDTVELGISELFWKQKRKEKKRFANFGKVSQDDQLFEFLKILR